MLAFNAIYGPDKRDGIGKLQSSRRNQSGIFTQAMAGNRRRPKSGTLEHPQGRYADREQRRLRVFGQVQLF